MVDFFEKTIKCQPFFISKAVDKPSTIAFKSPAATTAL